MQGSQAQKVGVRTQYVQAGWYKVAKGVKEERTMMNVFVFEVFREESSLWLLLLPTPVLNWIGFTAHSSSA